MQATTKSQSAFAFGGTQPSSPRGVEMVDQEQQQLTQPQPFVFQQWNPFSSQYEGTCWNAETGQYESVASLQNRRHFQRAFGNHLHRQTQTKVIDTYLVVERKEAQKRFCSAHAATAHLQQIGKCGHCQKNNCPICAVGYAADVRTNEGYEAIRGARKTKVKRRFEKFVGGGNTEQARAKRVRGLFKQPTKNNAPRLPAVCE
jgi:hypothetical protein